VAVILYLAALVTVLLGLTGTPWVALVFAGGFKALFAFVWATK
jgi:hypothetical protein